MRYLGRTHGVSVAWLHETFKGKDLDVAYDVSARMCADIYTKAFTDPERWKLASSLICACDPKELDMLAKLPAVWDQSPTQSEGGGHQHQACPFQHGGCPFKISCQP